MKLNHIIFVLFIFIVFWLSESQFNSVYSNENGAPTAVSGSPGDGNKTCAKSGCHSGNAVVNVPNLITSNIPLTGYVPGTTYTITTTCTQSGINKWGFEISPQNASGALLGQLIITNTTTTKITGTKYVTQKTAGSNGTGSRTWSFDWVAPIVGTGDVTFYGSFNYANNNGGTGGDHIKTSALVVTENTGTTGISAENGQLNKIEVWPNPVIDNLTVKFYVKKTCELKIGLISIDRKSVKVLTQEIVFGGLFLKQYQIAEKLPSGIYFLTVATGEETVVKKITILE